MKRKYVISGFLLVLIYYMIVNFIFFAPLSYSVKQGSFNLSSGSYETIFDQWARKITIKIHITTGGPLTLIHQVISDDVSDVMLSPGDYKYSFHTNRISLLTILNSTICQGTYTIIDHTSPLLPSANPYDAPLEIYIEFVIICSFLLVIVISFFLLIIGLFYIIKNQFYK